MPSESQPGSIPIHKPKEGVGLQLIIFGELERSQFNRVVQMAQQHNYDYLEATLNFLAVPPADLDAYEESPSIPLRAIHVGYPDIQTDEKLDALLRTLRRFNASFLICSGQEALSTDPLISCINTSKRFNDVAACCKAVGITFLVHTFDWIFLPCGGYVPLEQLLDRTDPALVGFNIDVFWAATAGRDLTTLIAKLRTRCNYFHIKDGCVGTSNTSIFKPLGKGSVPIRACLDAISRLIDDYYLVVEQDKQHLGLDQDLSASRRFLLDLGI